MSDRIIFHVDVNSAYLSWEATEHLKNGGTEDYRTMLAAVGGDIVSRHGIILAKSIPTKAYGIVTGESVTEALKKCPNLLLLKPHHGLYSRYSHALMDILSRFSDRIEQFSVDEAFLDMTGTSLLFGPPKQAADTIRDTVRNELGFTVNVGVSVNKLLAKMASDFTKPDKTHTLFPEEIPAKMWPLPVNDLLFAGRNTVSKLNTLGIMTIGDLARFDKDTLIGIMKKQGEYLWNAANGIGSDELNIEEHDAKSYSHETTMPYDLSEESEALAVLRDLTDKVCLRLRKDDVKALCVGITIKFTDLSRTTCQCILPNPSDIAGEIFKYIEKLFKEKWNRTPIRLLGMFASKIADSSYGRQMSLFDTTDYEKLEKLDRAMDSITQKYGKGSIKRASSLKKD